ncbi:MAG: tetratricopeptide repeat protein [Syntrophaceae bacterium]
MPKIIVFEDPLTAKEHNDLGLAYEQKGMWDLAEKEYLKAAEKQKGWYVPPFNLGNLSYKQKNLERTEKYYRRALDLDRDNPDTMNNLANLLFEKGSPEEAKQLIERALSFQRKPEYLDTYRRVFGRDAP